MRTGGLSISHLLKERGFEPIFFLSCRDRNRLALQADLLSAWILGIKNVAKAWFKRDGIEIIDSKTGDIKATLYSFSDSRLAVTSGGFFSGDGDFAGRVHFIKNNRFCEKNRFYDVFYRPGLVKNRLAGNR